MELEKESFHTAFLLSPLAPCLLMWAITQNSLVFVVGCIVAYLITLIFAVPAFFLLKRLGPISALRVIVLAIGIGFFSGFGLVILDDGLSFQLRGAVGAGLFFGAFGFLSGLSFVLISKKWR